MVWRRQARCGIRHTDAPVAVADQTPLFFLQIADMARRSSGWNYKPDREQWVGWNPAGALRFSRQIVRNRKLKAFPDDPLRFPHLNSCHTSVTFQPFNPLSPYALALMCSREDQRMAW